MAKKQDNEKNNSVSVIMPSYYTGPALLHSIRSVLSQKPLKELILVDNGNSNYTRGKVEELSDENDKLHIISGQGNIGLARACNLAQHEVSGEYILLLNPNCILPPSAIAKAVKALQKNPKAWVAGCRLVTPEGKERQGNRRNILTFKNMISEWSGLYKHLFLPRVELHESIAPKGSSYIPAISDNFMLMKKDTYEQVGGMDKDYFLHIEDMDFCFRINELGGKVIYINDIEVIRADNKNEITNIKSERYRAKSTAHYFAKNYDGAYIPGTLSIIKALLYTRFAIHAVPMLIKKAKQNFQKPLYVKEKQDKYLRFLEKYTSFKIDPKMHKRDPKYFITNRAPILITNVDNQIGLCILRRLLAADIKVIALYKDDFVDMYHPKLTWVKNDFGSEGLDIPSDIRPKTVICTSEIQQLPKYLEQFASMGTKRVICFNSLTIFNSSSGSKIKEKIIAEQQVASICTLKGLDYTVLRNSMVYGVDNDNSILSIYNFIKRFGFLPTDLRNLKIYQPVHADDLAIAALKILNIDETYRKNYNLMGGEHHITYNILAEKLFKLAGKRKMILNSSILTSIFEAHNKFSKKHNVVGEILEYHSSEHSKTFKEAKKDFGYSARNFTHIDEDDLGAG